MWVISLAAWTTYYRAKLKLVALPSINAALAHATGPIQFILHTDEPADFADVHFAGDVDIRLFQPDPSAVYQSYGNADRIALELAPEDANIALIPSDVMVSCEFFEASEKRFAQGKGAIVGSAARTLVAPEDCPAGLSARDLLGWSFSGERQHPVSAGCYYGEGKNVVGWMTYFRGPQGTVGRAFHLHPFAVRNDRVLFFNRETVDLDLLDRFSKDEIHVVVDPDEMAFAEISGTEKAIPQMAHPVSVGSIVSWARNHSTPLQRYLFQHRIVVQGTGEDHLDEVPANEILRILG
mgnify:FL=1